MKSLSQVGNVKNDGVIWSWLGLINITHSEREIKSIEIKIVEVLLLDFVLE